MLDQVRQQKPDPAMVDVLSGRRRGLSALLPFAGPAMVVSVAYIDPGNFATNIAAGSKHGYLLLWVVLLVQIGMHGINADNRRRVMCLSLFWHFLDLIWIGVYSLVYLTGVVL